MTLVNISANRINTIEPGCFEDMEEVNSLDLSFNSLVNVYKGTIDQVGVLHHLNLTQNNLIKIDLDMFVYLVLLENTGFCCVLDTKHCFSNSSTKYDNRKCGNLISKPVKVVYLFIISFGIVLNVWKVIALVRSQTRSALALFERACWFINILKCACLSGIVLSDFYYGSSFSYLHQRWKNHMICFLLGVVFIATKQVYFFSCLGQSALKHYIVGATRILKTGEKSTTVLCYLLSSSLVCLSMSTCPLLLAIPTSDLCLSFSVSNTANIVTKICIFIPFCVDIFLVVLMIQYVVKIRLVVAKVEKEINKRRKKTWIVRVYMIILTNCICGIIPEGIVVAMIFTTVFVEDWIHVLLSVLTVLLHPVVMK